MKKRFIEWAEENSDKANVLQIAKTGLGKMDMDATVDHFLEHKDADLEKYLKSFSEFTIFLISIMYDFIMVLIIPVSFFAKFTNGMQRSSNSCDFGVSMLCST
ncbi:MAG: hypothetical protein HRU07_04535 [Nitrosopumilus sp.]|nr:hypothetical protein [Nitrosopumilus sp.]NRA05420.1 hypothetical protein [Nitrosopumilus sp.]